MTREEIHKLPWKAQEYINSLERKLASFSVSGSLQKAFDAGCRFETGEQDSEKTYNKFTGYQEPNNELNFKDWFDKNYR